MKTNLKIAIIMLVLAGSFVSCGDEKLPSDHQDGILPTSIEQITDVFELKYGEVKECNYDGQILKLSITEIEDNRKPCHLMDFGGDPEGLNKIRLHAYFRVDIDGKISQLKVSSMVCGPRSKQNYNGSNIVQLIWDELEIWESEREIVLNPDYFKNTFTWAYGEGSLIENTPFSIFMATADPPINDWDDLASEIEKDQYQFTFIITKK